MIRHYNKIVLLGGGLVGALIGFGIGTFGGSPSDAWLWMVMLGFAGCYFVLAHKQISTKTSIIILFYSVQICFFTSFGAIISLVNADPFSLPFGLRYGVLLSVMLGIYATEAAVEIPGGFLLITGTLMCGGAGVGAIMGLIGGFNIGLCAIFGSLIAGMFPYYILLLRHRIVFITLIVSITLSLQMGFFLSWSLLWCFYVATLSSLCISLVFSTLDLFWVYGLTRPPVLGTLPVS